MEGEVVFNKHSIESESHVTRRVIRNLEFYPRTFAVLIRCVKGQSVRLHQDIDVQIN